MKAIKTYIIVISVLFLSLFAPSLLRAQDILTQMQNGVDVNVLFNKEALGGAFIHTEGWGLFFRKANIVSIYRKRFWEVETATMHSPKEYKVQNGLYPDANSYDYGKLNSIQIFRFGVGFYQMIWRKNNARCVEIDAVYSIGPSLALAKPVYLQVISGTNDYVPVIEQYNPSLDNPGNIYGGASYFDGFSKISFYPGGYARGGLNFDFANKHNLVKAIEVGAELDVYPRAVPIMAFNPSNQYFLTLYLSFSMGKRWFTL